MITHQKWTTILGKSSLPCQARRAVIISLPLMSVITDWMWLVQLRFGLNFSITANYTLNTYSSKTEEILDLDVVQVGKWVWIRSQFQKWIKTTCSRSTWAPSFSLSLSISIYRSLCTHVCVGPCVSPRPHFHGKLETYGLLQCYNTGMHHIILFYL